MMRRMRWQHLVAAAAVERDRPVGTLDGIHAVEEVRIPWFTPSLKLVAVELLVMLVAVSGSDG